MRSGFYKRFGKGERRVGGFAISFDVKGIPELRRSMDRALAISEKEAIKAGLSEANALVAAMKRRAPYDSKGKNPHLRSGIGRRQLKPKKRQQGSRRVGHFVGITKAGRRGYRWMRVKALAAEHGNAHVRKKTPFIEPAVRDLELRTRIPTRIMSAIRASWRRRA